MNQNKSAKETKEAYLEEIKKLAPGRVYYMVLKILDIKDEFIKSELAELTQKAEQKYLYSIQFDPTDILKGEELAKFMELDNEERIKFGGEAEWTQDSINLARSIKTLLLGPNIAI